MVPARHAEGTITAALRSVLDDTHTDLEIIVVNDGSSPRITEAVAALDDERVMLVNRPAAGVSAARNAALDVMTGDWLTLLDADDQWLPGRVGTLLAQARLWQAPIVADDVLVEHTDTGVSHSLLHSRGLLDQAPCDISATQFARFDLGWLKPFVRADLVEGLRFPQHIRQGEDFHFWFRVIRRAGALRLAPQAGYRYRYRQARSLSVDAPELWLQVITGTSGLLELEGLTTHERKALEHRLWLAWGRYHRLSARQLFQAGETTESLMRVLTKPSMLGERVRAASAHAARWARRQAPTVIRA
jgi:glycosyltransferase involved in cell wall biosynthesis